MSEALHALLTQAVALHQGGDLAAAGALYRQVLAADPANPDALHLYGVLSRRTSGAEAALRLFRRALAVQPRFPAASANMGNTQIEAGDKEGGAATFRAGLRETSNDPLLLRLLTSVLLAGSRFEEALPAAEALAQAAPHDPNSRKFLRLVHLARPVVDPMRDLLLKGMEYERAGRLADAETQYRYALRCEPSNPDGLNLLARLAARTNRRPLAEYLLDRRKTRHPTAALSFPI